MKSNRIVLVLLAAAAASQVFADVAPPPGFSAVGNALELRSSGSLDGFRFFLQDAGGAVEEIVLESAGAKVIDASGRVGVARYATLWAVPSKSIPEGELAAEGLEKLSLDLQKQAVEGQTKLFSHEFRKDVWVIESGGEHRDVYEIAMDPASGKPSARPNAQASASQSGLSYLLIAFAVGGILICTAIVLLGVMLFRRSRKSRVE
ncbi:MAG TPA: hypothetical protein VMM38_08180 [Aridibacter sp.]|nr:hypothetical protein [Aridibacter sp.]